MEASTVHAAHAEHEVLLALYEQSSEWSRQHEQLRAQVVGLMLAVAAAVTALMGEDGVRPGDWLLGAVLLAGGLLGWLMLLEYGAKIRYYGRLTRLAQERLDAGRVLEDIYRRADRDPSDARQGRFIEVRGRWLAQSLPLTLLWDVVPLVLLAGGGYILLRAIWLARSAIG